MTWTRSSGARCPSQSTSTRCSCTSSVGAATLPGEDRAAATLCLGTVQSTLKMVRRLLAGRRAGLWRAQSMLCPALCLRLGCQEEVQQSGSSEWSLVYCRGPRGRLCLPRGPQHRRPRSASSHGLFGIRGSTRGSMVEALSKRTSRAQRLTTRPGCGPLLCLAASRPGLRRLSSCSAASGSATATGGASRPAAQTLQRIGSIGRRQLGKPALRSLHHQPKTLLACCSACSLARLQHRILLRGMREQQGHGLQRHTPSRTGAKLRRRTNLVLC